ncbi:MAG TPA: YheU family protein [Candidatus Tenderia electrophaga]|uniref:YheU family protein n=1 Tax=Candidatus Tenderia electrophaga TaxID=1748243 RepID=A0A832J7P7_9GAMM|nr:YheU family protein [Candidatus Tenderia electrophaga]
MIVPHTEIAKDTLLALIEEFVTRDGTDYGEHEVSTEQKIQQVMSQLERQEIYIVYSELHETCTLKTKQDLGRE